MKIDCAILGATGAVGQKAIALLQNHPTINLKEITASPKNRGKRLRDVTIWWEKTPLSNEIDQLQLKSVDEITSPVAISALPTESAKEIEPLLTKKGIHVFSNASAFRMAPNVPLMIPEINGHLADYLKNQETPGKIVTNPNCAAVVITLALAPILENFKIDHAHIVTMQAISGAGHPGLSSLDILSDLIPYINNEEDKIQEETRKILSLIAPNDYSININVNRVPVRDGHTIVMHLHMKENLNLLEIEKCFENWNKKHPNLYHLYHESDRPRPRLDLSDLDQSIHIGRIRKGERENIISLVAIGHNLVRGAAGAALKNLEHCLPFLV